MCRHLKPQTLMLIATQTTFLIPARFKVTIKLGNNPAIKLIVPTHPSLQVQWWTIKGKKVF